MGIEGEVYRESPIAVAASEAGLVVDDSISGQEIYEMDGLLACLALVEGAAERHSGRAQSPKVGKGGGEVDTATQHR